MNGILLVDKPAGWTSFDVVGKVRRMVSQSGLSTSNKKRFPVGHTGTLDPLATGLLVLLLGNYTKKATQLTKLDKTYEVVMRLGQTSTTGDEEGEKTVVSDRQPTIEEIHIALARFEGDIMQVPPVFSAIKIDGQRAYKLAREGKAPKMEARPAHIDRIILTKYEYPDIHFTTHVGSGTYIRTLVEDIGTMLGTGAYMPALRRTRVGGFLIEDAVSMDGLTAEKINATLRFS
ncbi:MAG TPA: tRNA pseudouridine(55) synthase TruB [Candidatus Saccharimonadales bacterium]|jgi:tRNA pseudouridine55 synthase|nr:tRNA pseudouridine(55) synthase TruB [Candidatus Saccharimonadales bacterium]